MITSSLRTPTLTVAKPLQRGQIIAESDLASKVDGKRVSCTNLGALVRSGYLCEVVPEV